MTIQLRFTEEFKQGDTVVLKLPGFSRQEGSTTSLISARAVDGYGNPSPAFSAASWNEPDELLTLRQINPIRIVRNTLLRITVLQSAGVRLPGGGSVANRTDFLIRAIAAASTTPFEPLKQTEPVGVLYNTSLAFDPAIALTQTALTLNFTTSIQIEAGENATIELAEFTVASKSVVACEAIICSDIWGLNRQCSFGGMEVEVSYTGSAVLIVLMISDTIRDLEMVSVRIPKSAGIVTPIESRRNNEDLLIGSESSAGPVEPAPVEVSNKIPRNSISFRPAKAATGECSDHDLVTGACTVWETEMVNIDVNIVLGRASQPTDTILLALPGFSRRKARQSLPDAPIVRQECGNGGCNSVIVPIGSSVSAVPRASWNESASVLRLELNASLPANSLVSVTIPASAGIHLPTIGLSLDSTSISFEHVEQTVQNPSEFPTSRAVGAFVKNMSNVHFASTGLRMNNDRDGIVVGRFSFVLAAPLAPSQCIAFCGTRNGYPLPFSIKRDFMGPVTVILSLPGFSRAGGNLDHFEIPDTPAFAYASWIESSSTLVLTATGEAPAGHELSVILPQDAGIFLPSTGVTHNSAKLRVATNAVAGPVLNTSIASTPAVGAITDAAVSFHPAKAGVPVTLTLTFSFSQDISAREYFTATLPGFARTPQQTSAVTISATVNGVVTPMWGEWIHTSRDPILKMVVGAGGIKGHTKIMAVVQQSNEISLRETGMPGIKARKYWRVVNNTAVKRGWSVAEIRFFTDTGCTARVSTPHPQNVLGSSGADMSEPMNCSAFLYYNAIGNLSTGCPTGYRRARFAEIAGCKLALCDVNNRPEFLVGQGDGAYFLGAGYGCQVLHGTSSYAETDSMCVPQVTAAYNAFDNESSTSWLHFASSKPEASVGMKFESDVAVRCAYIEQERFDDDWAASSVALQSSADGKQWATIFEGPMVKGANLLHRPKGAKGSVGFESITLSASAVRGSCGNVRVNVPTPIGSFAASSSLTFGTPVAGSISNITLSVTPEMEIDVGELITVQLNGFTGNASDSLQLLARYQAPVFNGTEYGFVERFSYNPRSAAPVQTCADVGSLNGSCSNVSSKELPLFNATWDPDSHIVSITCGSVIYAGQRLIVTLLEANELRLPSAGIATSACGTGATVGPNTQIMADGTSAPCGICAGCLGINENTIVISSNARSGQVMPSPPTVVRKVERIGSFFNTSIDFGALTDSHPVNITVEFTYNFDLLRGDKVFLHLAEFTGISTKDVATFGLHAPALASATWNADKGLLAIDVTGSSIPALTRLQVSVPAAAHVILRSDGFVRNSRLLQISSNAVNGPVYPKAFDRSPAMGSFTTGELTRMSYTPGEFKADGTPYMEGRISAVTVGFSLNRDVAVGDRIFLGLTGFSRDSGDLVGGFNATALNANFSTVDTNGIFSSFMAASWAEATQRLTLTCSKRIPANQRHIVLVPSAAGLRLPRIGLTLNDVRLTIGTDAVAGPNTGTPIAHSPPLNELCGEECGAWAFVCGTCRCGPCAGD